VGPLVDWRTLALIAACLSGVLLLGVLGVLPETPTFLFTRKPAEAKRVMLSIRSSSEEAEADYAALGGNEPSDGSTAVVEAGEGSAPMVDGGAKRTGVLGLCAKGARAQFGIGCALMLTQQFSGINAVIFYSSTILVAGGINDPNLGGLIVMGVQVVATGIAVLLMERAGRRCLLLVSLAGMMTAALLLAVFFLNDNKPPFLALTSLVLYITAFSLGLGPIPWLVMGELFPRHIRATASSAATLLNWSCSFLVTRFFADVADALGKPGVFFLFSGICAAGGAFVAFFVPETRGKTFEEVEALFSR